MGELGFGEVFDFTFVMGGAFLAIEFVFSNRLKVVSAGIDVSGADVALGVGDAEKAESFRTTGAVVEACEGDFFMSSANVVMFGEEDATVPEITVATVAEDAGERKSLGLISGFVEDLTVVLMEGEEVGMVLFAFGVGGIVLDVKTSIGVFVATDGFGGFGGGGGDATTEVVNDVATDGVDGFDGKAFLVGGDDVGGHEGDGNEKEADESAGEKEFDDGETRESAEGFWRGLGDF